LRQEKLDKMDKVQQDGLRIDTIQAFILPDPVHPVQKFCAPI